MSRRVLMLFAALAGAAGCAKPAPLTVYSHVAPFTLTAQDGQEFRSQSLTGHPWIADFIFTHCPGPCPRMTTQLRGILEQTRETQFVSFTVDPEHDTPATLADYAKQFHADTSRWHFLTGSRDALNQIFRYSFLLGTVDGSMTHSTRFALIDAAGDVRGFYASDDPDDLKKLVRDLRRLNETTAR